MCFKRELRKQEVAYFGEPEDMPGIAPDVLDLPGVDTIAWFFTNVKPPRSRPPTGNGCVPTRSMV